MGNFFSFLIFSFLLLGLDFFGWTGPVRAVVEKGSEPVKQVLHRQVQSSKFKIQNFKNLWQESEELRKRNEQLEREVAQLRIENRNLEIENSAAQRLLQAPLPAGWRFLPAQTLGRTRYLTINQGKRDGVREGMVAVFENILVGRVVSVSEKSAKIMLPTDLESKIAIKILRESPPATPEVVRGVVIGENDRFVLTKVLQGRELKVDSLVVTSGEDEVFPPNLLIGKIKAVEKEERQPYQTAEVEPLIDYNQLERVFLIMDFY